MQTFSEWVVSLSSGASLGPMPKLSLEEREGSGILGAGVTSEFLGLTDRSLQCPLERAGRQLMVVGVGNRLPFAKKTKPCRAQLEGSKLKKAVTTQLPLCPGARAAPASGMPPGRF